MADVFRRGWRCQLALFPEGQRSSHDAHASNTVETSITEATCAQIRRRDQGDLGRPGRRGGDRVWPLLHLSIPRARKRRGCLDLHLPADAGGERNAGWSTSGVEGLRFAASASYRKLSWIEDCRSKRGGKYLARYEC